MIWNVTERPNVIACSKLLEGNGFNVQITNLVLGGAVYWSVSAGGEVEEYLIKMLDAIEADGGYVDPDELLANAYALDAKNAELRRKQMVRSVEQLTSLMIDQDIRSAIEGVGFNGQGYWEMLPKILAIAQIDGLTTAIERTATQQRSI